jgi:acyl-coenzyme A synthetase/AMP-(fatty) acid ligase
MSSGRRFRGDWFVGGDLATMDEDGYIWFEGRNDDLMNAFGYRVSPQEVENVLLGHPAVAEAGVAQVRVREDVSIIAAFVVAARGSECDAAAFSPMPGSISPATSCRARFVSWTRCRAPQRQAPATGAANLMRQDTS